MINVEEIDVVLMLGFNDYMKIDHDVDISTAPQEAWEPWLKCWLQGAKAGVNLACDRIVVNINEGLASD